MADPRFFVNRGPLQLRTIAERTGAELERHANPDLEITDIAPLDQAGSADLSFLDNIKYKADFEASSAGACFVSPAIAAKYPERKNLLIHGNPYKAYALAAQMFYPELVPDAEISPAAHVHPDAKIGAACHIAAGAVVEAGVELGDACRIESGAIIKRNVKIGRNGWIGANAVLSHCLIGDHVRIYPGAKIGQDGFGFAIDPAGHVKVPQLGRVIIEDHVEIGANTTIDRGAGPDTVIGQGTWIDNLVQIGHNVKIGKGCVIVAQAGISGSTVLEDYAVLGGQAGLAGHLRVGKGARVAAQAGVMRDIPSGEDYMGSPAMPAKQFMRQVAVLKKLAEQKANKA